MTFNKLYTYLMETFEEDAPDFIGKTIVYATKDTSGGGTTSWKAKAKVVDYDEEYRSLKLDNGHSINAGAYREDGKLYLKNDFYIVPPAEDNILPALALGAASGAAAAVGGHVAKKILPKDEDA